MAVAFIVSTKGNDDGSTNVAPCPVVDTTGANFAIASVAWYSGFGANYVVQDAASSSGPWTLNTWTGLTVRAEPSTANFRNRLFYAKNLTPSATHYFRATAAQSYGTVEVLVFSGLDLSNPFVSENGFAANPYATIQPGAVTPAGPNQLIVTGCNQNNNIVTMTINLGFATPLNVANVAGSYQGGAISYLIQSGGPSSVNPTWTASGDTTYGSATIATFKTPGGSVRGLTLRGAGA